LVVKILGHDSPQHVLWEVNDEYTFQYILSRPRNPHILAAYGCGVRERDWNPQLGYIYMEYAAYGSLRDLQKRFERKRGNDDARPYVPTH
jgi:hypothetical protein